MFNIKGTIKVIMDVQQISDKFKKREFVLDTKSGQYDQVIALQLTQDNVDMIDAHKVGDEVNVSFDLRGREWTSPKDNVVKYFNTLSAWRIEATTPATAPQTSAPPPSVNDAPMVDETDDLPF